MDLKLTVIVGGKAGQEIRVTGPKFFIGRAEDCQLKPRSDLISRHHCVLVVEDRLVAVRDFGSKNGTYVNGDRVSVEQPLNDGDLLKVGPLEFKVSIKESSKKRPKVNSVQEAAARTAESDFDLGEDVSDWLSQESGRDSEGDTREIRLSAEGASSDTTIQANKPVQPEPAAEEPESPSTIQKRIPGEKPGEKKTPGKLPAVKPGADNSFDAAADMLKRLRRR
jgi:pSer/pThr/pTyr-binding forkhead associated (FHA) protein